MNMPALTGLILPAVIALGCVAPRTAIAKISGPAPSYAVSTADGAHLFVMLSNVPVTEDKGNEYTLPNRSKILLRERYAVSGLYPIASTAPVWTIAWYGESGLVHLSASGRYVVRVNRFGGGGYGEGIFPTWGIKFYDLGREVATHNVQDLVDDLSLMLFTSDDWHYLWVGDSKMQGQTITLWTTTHEWYRFDIRTGQILERHRLWGKIHLGFRLFFVASVAAGILLVRKLRQRQLESEAVSSNESNRHTWWTLGCRSLLAGVALSAVLCGLTRSAPHWAVLLTGIFLAGLSTASLLQRKRTRCDPSGSPRSFHQVTAWTWALTSWLLLYFLSLGPVLGICRRYEWPYDVRQFVVTTVYAPLWWLGQHGPTFVLQAIEWYLGAWY